MDREILIYAFRYALGRCSMAPLTVRDAIKEHYDVLTDYDVKLIIRVIDQAIDSDMAGMACDVMTWISVKNFLKNKRIK